MKRLLLGVSLIALFLTACQKAAPNLDDTFKTQPIDIPNENEIDSNTLEAASASLQIPYDASLNISFNKEEFLKMVNEIRAKGAYCAPAAPPLRLNNYLETAAAAHAKDMALHGFLGHIGSGTQTDPAKKAPGIGSYFMDRILFFGYPAKSYDQVGENATLTKDKQNYKFPLKTHFKKALELYVNDPPHCKILLNPRFKDVGIGVYKSGKKYYWVMDLGEPPK